jgi:hypothetical protein
MVRLGEGIKRETETETEAKLIVRTNLAFAVEKAGGGSFGAEFEFEVALPPLPT